MSKRDDKNQAISLRKQGLSYSQIKTALGISKSTLSLWLRDIPLSDERIRELRDYSQIRIEKTRLTKERKRSQRLSAVAKQVSKDIGNISQRELLIAGFFLYWAEGGKTQKYSVILANTDPAMIRAFLVWVRLLGAQDDKISFKLHLYSDMNIEDELLYWSKQLRVPKNRFKNTYVKKSKLSDLTYVTRGHGTCNAIVSGRDISEYVLEGIKRASAMF